MTANSSLAPLSDRCALIVGVGRSGTTLLAKLLDSSREVLYRNEPDVVFRNTTIPFTPTADDINRHRDEAHRYFAQLSRHSDERSSGSRPVFQKAFRSKVGNWLMPAWVYGAKAAGKLGIRIRVPDLIVPDRQPLVLVKSVNAMRGPIFAKAMPDLKVIHITRHPCGVLSSLVRGRMAGKMVGEVYLEELFKIPEANAYGLTYDDLVNASYAEQQAFRWMVRNDFVANHLADSPNYLFVSYEKLCSELDTQTKRLCTFLELDMDPQMQAFIRRTSTAPSGDVSYFSVVRNILSGLAKWETDLSCEQAESIIRIVERSPLGRKVLEEYKTQRARID